MQDEPRKAVQRLTTRGRGHTANPRPSLLRAYFSQIRENEQNIRSRSAADEEPRARLPSGGLA